MASNLSQEQSVNVPGEESELRLSPGSSFSQEGQHLIESTSKEGIKGNIALTSFNYINSIIGSGVVGIPYALRSVGFGMGIILLIVIAIATDFSLCILVEAGHVTNVNSYQDLIHSQFGFIGYCYLTFIQFAYPFIAMISYNVIIGDTITKVLRRIFNLPPVHLFGNRFFVCFLATLFITYPLCLFKAIVKLSVVSFISLTLATSIMVFVLIRAFVMTEWIKPTTDAFVFARGGITQAIGVIAFAYMCHHNSYLLYDSLENATQKRWNRVTHISVGVSAVIMMTFGISGYVIFTENSQGDLLENFCLNDDWANVARIMFAITIILTYPIECFVAKDVFMNVYPTVEDKHIYILTTVLVVATFLLSIATDCLSIILELNGVLAAVPLAYILPAAAFIKACEGTMLSPRKLAAGLLVVLGVIVAIVGFWNIIVEINRGVKCIQGVNLPYCTNATIIGNYSY